MGTTVLIQQKDRRFYFAANSKRINESRVEARQVDLLPTLSGLWAYLATFGAKEELVIPILGTGNGRLSMPREEVFKEIVRSFIASCSEKSYCEKLTIVIRSEDVDHCEINVDILDEFLCLNCKYATFSSNQGQPSGTPA